MRRSLFLLALLASGTPLAAQAPPPAGYTDLEAVPTSALAVPVTVSMTGQPLALVLAEIARQARLSFVADRALPGLERPTTLVVSRVSARVALRQAIDGTPLRLLLGPNGQLVVVRRGARADGSAAIAGQAPRLRLAGYVRNASTNEVVRRATIVVATAALPTQANEEGFYAVQLPVGQHTIGVRAMGFAPLDTVITMERSTTLDFVLRGRSVVLSEVRVQAAKSEDRPDLDPRVPDMSVVRLDLTATRLVPPLLGEVDPLRTLSLLPGVATTSDASTAFSVRGGGADQNLVQLDEATVYNPSHVLGFLSTFNADAIDDVTLYKGAIPVKFGGRLSSVVDIRQREGNANEFEGKASIGLLSSRVILEGPLVAKQRGSWMVAARRSYADLFTGLSSDTNVQQSRAYFYDVNAKANLRLGATGSVMLSGYAGRDNFNQASQRFGAGWGNVSGTLRWNQAFANRLFSKVSATVSQYDYLIKFTFAAIEDAKFEATIASASVRVDETLQLTNHHRLEFGGELIDHRFDPGSLGPRGSDTTNVRRRRIETRNGYAGALYLGHEAELGERVAIRYGVRWAGFDRVGRGTRYFYANDAPVRYNNLLQRYEPGLLVDSAVVPAGQSMARYGGWEPRASMRLSLTPQHSLKGSYARTQQFVQLISNTNAPTPLNVWEPVGQYIRPQVADQFAAGYSGQWRELELTAEAYYKRAQNVIDYLDGSDIALNNRQETGLVQGNGRAYGVELYVRRTRGRNRGWVSYTLGRAEQRFPVPRNAGATSGGGVNEGRWYPTPFDKTHTLVVAGIRDLNRKWVLGSTFQLATGLPVTLPQSRFMVDGFVVPIYGPRNSARLPLYHRLDVNFTRTLRRGELQFGVLNAYNRFNAQSLRVRFDQNTSYNTEAVQTSIFGIIPSINYVFRF
ncbi:MAG: TonB-dependent receptor [Gemmatimonadaceae bacterium]|nr:TonB-dependent receptor [Gemmatimonadaceae bacterium]